MPKERALWALKLLLFAIVGAIVAGRATSLLELVAWLAFRQAGSTTLSRSLFSFHFYVPFSAITGLLLGLVPFHRVREALAATFARFQTYPPSSTPELTNARPILWAWIPFGLLLCFRLFTFSNGKDQSVLGLTTYSETRWDHFFTLPVTLRPVSYFDQILVVAPFLALLAYSLGVWLRHQFPSSQTPKTPTHPT